MSSAKPTLGQRAAEFVAARVGSWPFIIWQSCALATWVTVNTVHAFSRYAWDPEPYILLNLMLSFQAAYTGPIVMIAQNRSDGLQRETLRTILTLARGMRTMLEEWTHNIKLLPLVPVLLDDVRALRQELAEFRKEMRP